MKKTIEIDILGQKYPVRTEADEEWVRKVAAFLNQKLDEVISSRPTIDREKAVVLAALNIAGELFQIKQETDRYREHVTKKSDELMKLLDAQL